MVRKGRITEDKSENLAGSSERAIPGLCWLWDLKRPACYLNHEESVMGNFKGGKGAWQAPLRSWLFYLLQVAFSVVIILTVHSGIGWTGLIICSLWFFMYLSDDGNDGYANDDVY